MIKITATMHKNLKTEVDVEGDVPGEECMEKSKLTDGVFGTVKGMELKEGFYERGKKKGRRHRQPKYLSGKLKSKKRHPEHQDPFPNKQRRKIPKGQPKFTIRY